MIIIILRSALAKEGAFITELRSLAEEKMVLQCEIYCTFALKRSFRGRRIADQD